MPSVVLGGKTAEWLVLTGGYGETSEWVVRQNQRHYSDRSCRDKKLLP